MSNIKRCPDCGAECPPEAPDGLCPRCLMTLGFNIEQGPSRTTDEPDAFERRGIDQETIIALQPSPSDGDDPPTSIGAARGGPILLDEIARGGMGVIHRGRDQTLSRPLAIKVLRESNADDPECYRRFVSEARITGQLQHPGIVPVYELGMLQEQKPYFTMKLVKGQTLAELSRARAESPADRPKLLRFFLQVAQTVAYAHDHGVVHRDLKPENIMVGKYDEVLVMDWGLAELIGEGDSQHTDADAEAKSSQDSGDEGERLAPGLMVGTPVYMSPERFTVAGSRADRRGDVFALGAILFEILTGQPIYDETSALALFHAGSQGRLSPNLTPLEHLPIDAALVELTRSCLEVDPAKRPRDAGEVAERLTVYLEGIEDQLRQAELSRAAAEARAVEEHKRRRLWAVLSGLGITLILVLSVGYMIWQQQREQQRASAALVLSELEVLRDEAASDPWGDPASWRTAREAAEQADRLLADASDAQQQSLQKLTATIDEGLERSEADQRLITRLDRAMFRVHNYDFEKAASDFTEAFTEAGYDLTRRNPRDVGREIATRPEEIRAEIIAAMDSWIVNYSPQSIAGRPHPSPREILNAVMVADSDPLRWQMRELVFRVAELRSNERPGVTVKELRDGVQELIASVDFETLPVATRRLMGQSLRWLNLRQDAVPLLQRAWRAHPNDFLLNMELYSIHRIEPSRPDLALVHASSAVALRPDSASAHLCLAIAYHAMDDLEAAEAEYREAVRLDPEFDLAHIRISMTYYFQKRYDEAIEHFRVVKRIRPDRAASTTALLANSLLRLDRLDEAITELEQGVKAFPKDFKLWLALGSAHVRRGDRAEAVAAFDRAEKLAAPGSPSARQLQSARQELESLH